MANYGKILHRRSLATQAGEITVKLKKFAGKDSIKPCTSGAGLLFGNVPLLTSNNLCGSF